MGKLIFVVPLLISIVLVSGCVQESAVIEGVEWFQEGNTEDINKLQPRPSSELEDNRIGTHTSHLWHTEYDPELFPNQAIGAWSGHIDPGHILGMGIKRIRLAINDVDSDRIDWDRPELSVDPSHDEFITALSDNGLKITYMLSFWDKEGHARGEELGIPRFRTEEEIERYLEFVKFIVHHFKDRIEYYEIWNEPNIGDTPQWIEVEDYIKLVKRAVPVIREEYPEAKIVVGSTSSLIDTGSQEYLFSILRSDIMPMVDVVEWHPLYGQSPEYEDERQYYYGYPSLIQEIKDTASANGFTGEYVADEIHWCTPDQIEPDWHVYSETKSSKYYARGIVMHLGEDVTVSQIMLREKPNVYRTIQNLCTIMSGAETANLSVEIQGGAENIKSYSFSLSNGDNMVALWTDGAAVDVDPGVEADLAIRGLAGRSVTATDVLNGYQQSIKTSSSENGNLVIESLIVRDYPVILRIG
jgi:hypothetical protein